MQTNLSRMNLKYKNALFYIGICLIGLIEFFHPVFTSGFVRISGDMGDGLLNNYFLEHTWRLINDKNYGGSLYSPNIFFPYQNTLAFSDNLFGAAPIYWASRFFLPPDISFVLWLLIISILNFSSMTYVLRQEKVYPILAALGGFLFAFPATRYIHIVHGQLFPQFCTPLALWITWKFFQKPDKIKFSLILFLVYWQILCGIYLGWFLLLALVCLGFASIAISKENRKNLCLFAQTYWRFVLISCLIWSGALYLFLSPYLEMKNILGGGYSYEYIVNILPQLGSWLLVPRTGHMFSPILGVMDHYVKTDFIWEHYIFVGIITTFLILGSSIYLISRQKWLPKNRRDTIAVFLIVGWGLVVLSLNFGGGMSMWRVVYLLFPGASAIRAVTRINLIILPCFLMAGLIWCNGWIQTQFTSQRYKIFLLLGFLTFGIWEQNMPIQTYDATIFRSQTSELGQAMKKYCQVAYLSPIAPSSGISTLITNHVTAMWSGMIGNIPVINGYSGSVPPGFSYDWDKYNDIQNWLRLQNVPNIDRVCFITRIDSPYVDTPKNITVTESHRTPNYVVNVFRYININDR